MELIVLKTLTKTDVEKRMSIPIESLEHFPPLCEDKHVVDFPATDECGRVWTFQIWTRKNQKCLKPVLTKEWREFVCSKELCINDTVAFYMEEEETGSVKYYVKDKVPNVGTPKAARNNRHRELTAIPPLKSMKQIVLKTLTTTDVYKRMTFPSKSLNPKYFPSFSGDKHVLDFQARDELGWVWFGRFGFGLVRTKST
ncbi:hypothetical protein GQ457_18G019990 [Hibiscus cannabinus]